MGNPPLSSPQQSLGRGYKFAWRLLLVSNLALGAYIFSRPRKKDTVRKDKKATTKVPYAPIEIAATPHSVETTISTPITEPVKIPEPIPESQWSKPFKW